jgi:hypothetical protein
VHNPPDREELNLFGLLLEFTLYLRNQLLTLPVHFVLGVE